MIKLFAIGKNKNKHLQALCNEYLKRITPFMKITEEEFRDEPDVHSEREGEARRIKEAEGTRVLSKIKPQDFVVLLDLHGKMVSSEEFARLREDWSSRPGDLVFVIAGSLGPSEDLVKRANYRWKISDLTLTHLMCRLIVLEQIYRSFMIENHRTYHK